MTDASISTAGMGRVKYLPEQVWLPASECLLDWGEEFHDLLLNDSLRMTAYRAAIREAVKPGARVLDLGTGTGILAQWALEAGAGKVYGIEVNARVLADATARLERAGVSDRFVPLNGLSFDIELPERVDVVMSEILGNLADNEGCVPILADARKRFLAKGGRMLPSQVESYLVPVEAADAHSQVGRLQHQDKKAGRSFGDRLRGRGLDSPFDMYYDVILPRTGYLATPRLLQIFRFAGNDDPSYDVTTVYTAAREGLLTGFKGYFVATLSESVGLDIAGDDIEAGSTSDSWKHCYLPIEGPIRIQRGDRITLSFARTQPAGSAFAQAYAWHGQVLRGPATVGEFSQATVRPADSAPSTCVQDLQHESRASK